MLSNPENVAEALAPNVSTDARNFFQSDRDLELERVKEAKREQSAAKDAPGKPIFITSKVLAFELLANGTQALVAESGHIARIVDLESGDSRGVFRGHTGPVTSVVPVYGSDGTLEYVYTGSWDKTVKKWDAKTFTAIQTFIGHSDFIKQVRLFRDTMYTASSDKTIRQWDVKTGTCTKVYKEHTMAVEDILLTEDGALMYSASSDTSIKKWDTASGALLSTLQGHLTSVYALRMTDGQLWSVSADKFAKRWDLETDLPDSSFEHPDFVRSIEVLNGGAHIATGSRDENIRLWDVATEKCVKILVGHFGEVSDIRLHGNTLWTSSLDGTIRRWRITSDDLKGTGELVQVAAPAEKPTKKKGGKTAPVVSMTAEEEAELADLMGSDED
ncbi:WD40-repeat-containing domain protein [Phlyctochytrium arcticum]|nr:WD40-repeat-containing domain protein [Phlyctochytrium arcticum]